MALNVGNGVMLYSPPDAARTLGVPLTMLNWWSRTGFLEPSIVGPRGKGRTRFYSFSDLVALKVATSLKERGIPLKDLRRVVDNLRNRYDSLAPLTESRLMIVNGDVVDYDETFAISVLRSPGQGILKHIDIVDLNEVVREIKDADEYAAA